MPRNVKWFIRKKLLQKTPFISRLAPRYMDKARANLVTVSVLSDMIENEEARRILAIPEDYNPSEWVVIASYYSMYMAALSTLARINYKSSNHSATIAALETFFVKKKMLEQRYIEMLEKAKLKREEVEQLELARERREIAQYSVTKRTTASLAKKQKEESYKFVERMEELLRAIRII